MDGTTARSLRALGFRETARVFGLDCRVSQATRHSAKRGQARVANAFTIRLMGTAERYGSAFDTAIWRLDPHRKRKSKAPDAGICERAVSQVVAIHAKNRQGKIGTQPSAKEAADEDKVQRKSKKRRQLLSKASPRQGSSDSASDYPTNTASKACRDYAVTTKALMVSECPTERVRCSQSPVPMQRYSGSVGRAEVGEFRNAMLGRADKGILITTGYFTSEAERSQPKGVPQSNLLMASVWLSCSSRIMGLRRREVLEVHSFFDHPAGGMKRSAVCAFVLNPCFRHHRRHRHAAWGRRTRRAACPGRMPQWRTRCLSPSASRRRFPPPRRHDSLRARQRDGRFA